MTSVLGKPAPLPYVDEEDLLSLAVDLGHGIFPSADIYNWYVQGVTHDGREPVSKKKFGLALKEAGWHNSAEYRDGRVVRCWLINKPWERRGQAWLKAQKDRAES